MVVIQKKYPELLKLPCCQIQVYPKVLKIFVDDLFTNPENERIEIDGIDEEFDEIEFELELNGKRKTFYVAHKNRIQPDIDVTSQIVFDEQGQPIIQSLIAQSEELIEDIIEFRIR